MNRRFDLVPRCLFAASCLWSATASAENWPRFRGENGSGLATAGSTLLADIGPDQHVLWKVALPPGHSSPAIFGD
jgi:outer membrane protein assembly factor BamB